MYQDQEKIYTIRTLECDICDRYDSLLLAETEIINLVNRNSLQIGSRIVTHGDHLRIIYFDIEGNYLGDTMSLNVTNRQIAVTEREDIPFLIKSTNFAKNRIHRKMLRIFTTKKYNISIVGPSMAGKTSLTLFLETGIPERESKRVNHAATMGKSTKHLELANNKLTVFDLGGQRDFWELWEQNINQSDKVIFVLDGAANNYSEIKEALEMLLTSITKDQTLLIIFNKLDLLLDGYCTQFLRPSSLLHSVTFPDHLNYWVIQASVYNGIVYDYAGKNEETTLSTVLIDFFNR